MNLEELNNNTENIKLSNDVKKQLENLGLTIDEIKGKCLDIGANNGQFANELEKITGADIVSIDNNKNENTPNDVIIADARKLPFEDGSFDKVVSHASIPNVFIGMYSEEFPELSKKEIKDSILKVFREILRVLKSGSCAVLAPVRIADNYNSEKALAGALKEVVEEIQKSEADIFWDLIKEEKNYKNGEKCILYRLTILKK